MMKEHKKLWFFTAVLTLMPILAGLLLWERLPNSMATHWGADGVIDGWSSKAFAVFALPCILFAIHCLCLFITAIDARQKEQSRKALAMVFWIMPVTSWFSCGAIYAAALGKGFEAISFVPAFMGLVFIIMGNYMPKVKQNRTMGIKLPWTFANEENWNRTHRFCGKVWVAGGAVMLLSVFLPESWIVEIMVSSFAVLMLVPVLYSFRLYRIHQRQGVVYEWKPKTRAEALVKRISILVGSVLVVGCVLLMITGNIGYSFTDGGLEIKADYWLDSFVAYEEIDTVEYRESCDFGVRTNGFGSARLSMGAFRSDEFGDYTRYSYTQCRAAVILSSGEKVLVLSAANEADTHQLYMQLTERLQ